MFDSKRLRDYLAENQLSQSDFAMKIGTSQTMVYFLANGIKEPSVKLLTRIADVMGCATDELLGRGSVRERVDKIKIILEDEMNE